MSVAWPRFWLDNKLFWAEPILWHGRNTKKSRQWNRTWNYGRKLLLNSIVCSPVLTEYSSTTNISLAIVVASQPALVLMVGAGQVMTVKQLYNLQSMILQTNRYVNIHYPIHCHYSYSKPAWVLRLCHSQTKTRKKHTAQSQHTFIIGQGDSIVWSNFEPHAGTTEISSLEPWPGRSSVLLGWALQGRELELLKSHRIRVVTLIPQPASDMSRPVDWYSSIDGMANACGHTGDGRNRAPPGTPQYWNIYHIKRRKISSVNSMT